MIKLLLLACLSLSLFGFDFAGNNSPDILQKKLVNKNAYNTMVNDLKRASALGDSNSAFFLGTLIYNGIALEDGEKVKPNTKEGIALLKSALSQGSVAAMAMLSLKSMQNNDLDTFTESLAIVKYTPTISLVEKDYYF